MATQDRTANRLALCSAIFAGFAYVGYAVVRTAFGGRRKGETVNNGFFRNENDPLALELEPNGDKKVYLRRLSGSSVRGGGRNRDIVASLTLPGQCEDTATGVHSVLRPLSVRERLRELNVNAMAFADTLLVLHGKKPLCGPRSLQSSPYHSPSRIMSPLDLHRSFAGEQLEEEEGSRPGTPRLSRRGSRRSLAARRSLANSVVNLTGEQQQEAASAARQLLASREQELTRRLESWEGGRGREMTPYEARGLVALLHSEDQDLLARALHTVTNCAAFTRNQDLLREAGCLALLPDLLSHPARAVRLAATTACSNLALNTGNLAELRDGVTALVTEVQHQLAGWEDLELLAGRLLCLTNLAVLPDWHHLYTPALPALLAALPTADQPIRLQGLKLLVNLSCQDGTVPALLDTECDPGLVSLLTSSSEPDLVLRCTTLLANICLAAARLGLDKGVDTRSSTLHHLVFTSARHTVVELATGLMHSSQSSDVKMQARKIYTVLVGLDPQ